MYFGFNGWIGRSSSSPFLFGLASGADADNDNDDNDESDDSSDDAEDEG